MSQSYHLVQDAAERPNIRLLVIRLLLTDLRRKVVRSSNGRHCTVVGVLEDSSNAKVAYLDGAILVHKDVLGLQVAVQYFPVVDVLDGQSHLHKPVQDLVLAVTDFAYLLLVRDLRVEVSSVCIVHDDAEASLVHKGLFVGDDVRMAHRLQNVDFVDGVLTLLPVHLGDIDDLHDVGLSILNRLHQDGESE